MVQAVHVHRLDPEFGFVEEENVVGAEFPDVAGELGQVAEELTVGAEGEPATVFAGPVVLFNPDASVAAQHEVGDRREEIGHRALVAEPGVVEAAPIRGSELGAPFGVVLAPGTDVRAGYLPIGFEPADDRAEVEFVVQDPKLGAVRLPSGPSPR